MDRGPPRAIQVLDGQGRLISEERRYYGDTDDDTMGRPLNEVGSRGLLKRVEVLEIADTSAGQTANDTHWINRERHRHDQYGNVVLTLDPLGDPKDAEAGHARAVGYDPVYHTHPVLEIHHVRKDGGRPVALRMHAAYDLALGKPIAATDFDATLTEDFADTAYGREVARTKRAVAGHVTRFAYDTHGRLTKIIRPGDGEDLPTQEFTYALADPVRGLVYAYTASGGLVGGAPKSSAWNTNVGGIDLTIGSGRSATISQSREVSGRPGVIVSITYSDGLGRTLARATEGNELGAWVIQDAVQFDGRGQVWRSYQPSFGSPDALLPEKTSFVEHHRDAEGRAVMSILPPDAQGVRDINRIEWLPLEERRYDEESCRDGKDGRPLGSRVGRYKALLRDGHDRLLEVCEHLRLTDDGEPASRFAEWKTCYDYDALHNLIRVVDAQRNVRSFQFDSLKRRRRLDDPDRGLARYQYDDASNLVRSTDARNQSLEFTHDGLNRVLTETGITNGVRQVIRYHYDNPRGSLDRGDGTTIVAVGTAGKLAWDEDFSGEEHFSYDDQGRIRWSLKRFAPQPPGLPGAFLTTTEYDAQDRIVRLTYPDGAAVRYDYNPRGLLAAISGAAEGELIVKVGYEPSGKVQSLTHGNGVATVHRYDDRTRLIRLTTTGQDHRPLIDYAYAYDGTSNVTRIADDRPTSVLPEGNPRRNTQVFDYDDDNRLTLARYALGKPDRDDGSITYRYDRIGNMVVQRSTGCVAGANLGKLTYGPGWDRCGRKDQTPGPHALIASVTGLNLEYDVRGNVIHTPDDSYTWDAWNHQIEFARTGTRARYIYDHQGRRTVKTVSAGGRSRSTYYVNKFYEIDEAGKTTRHILANDRRVAVAEDRSSTPRRDAMKWQGLRHFHQDHIGSTVLVTDASGGVTEEFAYEPYGRARHHWIRPNDPEGVKYRFAQKEEDAESGLHYFEARYLASSLSRFTTCDPEIFGEKTDGLTEPDRSNAYSYALNNPLSISDQTGKNPVALVAAGGALAIVATVYAIYAYEKYAVPYLDYKYEVFKGYWQAREYSNKIASESTTSSPLQAVDTARPGFTHAVPIQPPSFASEMTPAERRAHYLEQGVPVHEIGPSGYPKIHTVQHPSMKRAEDAARAEVGKGGTTVKHPSPAVGEKHFHGVDQSGNKSRVHHEYAK